MGNELAIRQLPQLARAHIQSLRGLADFKSDCSIVIRYLLGNGKRENKKHNPVTNHGNWCLIADMNGELISLAITSVIGLAAIVGFCWLMSSLLNNRDTWQSGGGAAFTPLQEMIQPQIRHVVEAQEQCAEEDDHGAPDTNRETRYGSR